MNIRRRLLTAGAATLLVAAPACSSTQGASGQDGHKLQVVAAFYPFQYVAQQVAGERADVSSLTAPGAEPHDLELTARQVGSLSEADLVVYQAGFQATVDKAIQQATPRKAVDVATLVTLLPPAGGGEEGEHLAKDPHEWLLPSNMVAIARGIQQKLAEVDPQGADTYRANADALVKKLDQLDTSFATGLKNCQRKDFITSHAAFQYLAKQYGLNQVGISGLSPDEEPSPARVAEVQRLARQHGVTTIFYENLVSPAQARAIAGDLGLRTDVLDPLEGITKDSRGSDYIAVQQSNLKALQQANGCK